MKTKIIVLLYCLCAFAPLREARAQTELPISPPSGAAAFDTNGLDFTNVTFKAAAGAEVLSGLESGTLTYLQGDVDAFKIGKAFDLGFGVELTESSANVGLQSANFDIEAIKNLSNFQLVIKLGYGREFQGNNVGNYGRVGVDINYNLTRGLHLAWLGNSSGGFTYVGFGLDWGSKDFDALIKQKDVEKSVRVYAGFAF